MVKVYATNVLLVPIRALVKQCALSVVRVLITLIVVVVLAMIVLLVTLPVLLVQPSAHLVLEDISTVLPKQPNAPSVHSLVMPKARATSSVNNARKARLQRRLVQEDVAVVLQANSNPTPVALDVLPAVVVAIAVKVRIAV
jgi:hypothetical protein